MNEMLQTAQWQHSKKKAELLFDDIALIEMEFTRKVTYVKIGKQKFEIKSDGFWCPKIMITEKDNVVGLQKQMGFWGTNSELVMEGEAYRGTIKQGMLFNLTYSKGDHDIVMYKLDTLKKKPVITFEIKDFDIAEKHLMLLMALGFYSIKNVAVEALANDFIVTAVA